MDAPFCPSMILKGQAEVIRESLSVFFYFNPAYIICISSINNLTSWYSWKNKAWISVSWYTGRSSLISKFYLLWRIVKWIFEVTKVLQVICSVLIFDGACLLLWQCVTIIKNTYSPIQLVLLLLLPGYILCVQGMSSHIFCFENEGLQCSRYVDDTCGFYIWNFKTLEQCFLFLKFHMQVYPSAILL